MGSGVSEERNPRIWVNRPYFRDGKYHDYWLERPFYSPYRWYRWLRIAFFLTLPISGPVWGALVIAGMMAFAAFVAFIVLPIGGLWELAENCFRKDRP